MTVPENPSTALDGFVPSSGPLPARAGPSRTASIVAALCYLIFVVYGSLVPLDYTPKSLDLAWREFQHVRYLALGVESRADWVANILLYMPLAYLLAQATAGGVRWALVRLVLLVAVYVFCAAVAVGVEFTQLFFPPRTVSQNDIIAELIGSGLGLGIWIVWGAALHRLWIRMERGGLPAIRAAVFAYVLAYLLLSLFPYDFLVSAQELADKLAGGNYGFLLASTSCQRVSACAGKMIAEVIAVVPLGVLLGMALPAATRRPYAIAALCGAVLGVTIEALQLFLASGISEGLSVATRTLGVPVGVALQRHIRLHNFARWRPWIAWAVLAAIPAYLLGLLWANGAFSARWHGLAEPMVRWSQIRWLPFYYHYFTTETHALRSLMAHCAMYMPVGLGVWAWTMRRSDRAGDETSAWVAALVAGPLALAMELTKLFQPDKHPDPTDALIAMAAAAGTYILARQMHRWAVQGDPAVAQPAAGHDAQPRAAPAGGVGKLLIALLLLTGTGIALLKYPLGGTVPAVLLMLYAAALWRYPRAALPTLLALLPVLNFAPWTGWILLNEFDLLMAVTLAVRLLAPRSVGDPQVLPGGSTLALGLLAASFIGSALRGLFPLSPLDANALVSYYGSFNSLAQLKGFAWALALLPMLKEEARDEPRMANRISGGILAGLCLVVAVVIWQRMAFAGIFDFASTYRVEGTFPELHTGTGDVHAYLVMACPFIAAWVVLRPSALRIALGVPLFLLTSYAIGVTFARGGYVGFVGAMAILAVAFVIYEWRHRAFTAARIGIAVIAVAAGAAVLSPIVFGSFMESRLSAVKAEAQVRMRHWAYALRLMDPGATTRLLGMGLGTFPRTLLFKDHEAASATFSYAREGDNRFVRLGSGRPLYFQQNVDVAPARRYILAVDLRSTNPEAKLEAALCEKSILYSFRCSTIAFAVDPKAQGWQRYELVLNSQDVGSGSGARRRPVMLSLANAQQGSIIEVDNVRLYDKQHDNFLVNGDFSAGSAHWYYTTDDGLPWHTFNLWVQLYFEQGWVGVIAFACVLLIALARLAACTWRGDLFAAAVLASLAGFLLVGITESLFDGPRITTLFFLVLFAGLLMSPRRRPGAHEVP